MKNLSLERTPNKIMEEFKKNAKKHLSIPKVLTMLMVMYNNDIKMQKYFNENFSYIIEDGKYVIEEVECN